MLLEKQLAFEPVILRLNGDQLAPEFVEINPFHHVPVLIDDEVKLIESLAILDYLEAKYPDPALIPSESHRLAQARVVQFLSVNELMPSLMLHIYAEPRSIRLQKSQEQLALTLDFLAKMLGTSLFFGGNDLTVADIVAGTVIPLLRRIGVDLSEYGALDAWCDRVMARPAWQMTALTDDEWYEFQRRIQIMALRKRRTQSQVPLKPVLIKRESGGAP